MVSRIYVEKKPGFDVEAQQLLQELHTVITEGLPQAIKLRIINMYDVEGITDELFNQCVPTVFSEPQVDNASFELPVEGVLMGAAGSGEAFSKCLKVFRFLQWSHFRANLISVPILRANVFSSFLKGSALRFAL